MSVKHMFLALLDIKPRHGYEIKEAFENLMFHQWPLNFGQVYTTLGRLERDGLVKHNEVEQEEKPDKKVYRITQEGREELGNWLHTQAKLSIYYDDMALKTALFEVVDAQEAVAVLRQYKQHLFSVLKTLMRLKAELKDAPLGKQLIIERNILKVESDLKWIDICQERIGGIDS